MCDWVEGGSNQWAPGGGSVLYRTLIRHVRLIRGSHYEGGHCAMCFGHTQTHWEHLILMGFPFKHSIGVKYHTGRERTSSSSERGLMVWWTQNVFKCIWICCWAGVLVWCAGAVFFSHWKLWIYFCIFRQKIYCGQHLELGQGLQWSATGHCSAMR